jgi:glycosyltransferase involved in cell wall biosynthesis
MYPRYRSGMNALVGTIFSLAANYMRIWDYVSAARVDYFVANSQFIASRIRKYYRRESTVIHPPVESAGARISDGPGDYYLAVGRMVDYKRFDLAVAACTKLGRRLKLIGGGPEEKALRQVAGPTVEFLGRVSDEELRENLAGCRALLFPGEEDFGIVPVEAQSFGKPVIAYGSGGVLETVRGIFPEEAELESPTGVFFTDQSEAGLIEGIVKFESVEHKFNSQSIREHSLQFDREIFKQKISEYIGFALEDFKTRSRVYVSSARASESSTNPLIH